jgi:tRNA C32,U32 (ribose-2'-O)-methylase TrmJ
MKARCDRCGHRTENVRVCQHLDTNLRATTTRLCTTCRTQTSATPIRYDRGTTNRVCAPNLLHGSGGDK